MLNLQGRVTRKDFMAAATVQKQMVSLEEKDIKLIVLKQKRAASRMIFTALVTQVSTVPLQREISSSLDCLRKHQQKVTRQHVLPLKGVQQEFYLKLKENCLIQDRKKHLLTAGCGPKVAQTQFRKAE